MRIRDRDLVRIAKAPLQLRHWQALARMATTYDRPLSATFRYLTNGGHYPWRVGLRTPLGLIQITLRDYHDLLTVNEIFCRQDYGPGDHDVVADIGANVGFAALFFLTRNERNRVTCFEPDPANTAVLLHNLVDFQDRYVLVERAVTPQRADVLRFVPGGRYGHTARPGEVSVELAAVGAEDALQGVIDREGHIDLVKIDTEGSENALVRSIRAAPLAADVRSIVYEDNQGLTRWI